MKQRGRPIRGAVAGLFFGVFISLDLVIFGVLALDAAVLALIPLLGIVAGVLLGVMAPMRRLSAKGKQPAPMPSAGGANPDSRAA